MICFASIQITVLKISQIISVKEKYEIIFEFSNLAIVDVASLQKLVGFT